MNRRERKNRNPEIFRWRNKRGIDEKTSGRQTPGCFFIAAASLRLECLGVIVRKMRGKKQSQSQPPDEIFFEEEGGSAVSELKKMREKLKECQKQKEEYLTGWQRAKADFINARNEEEKRREEFKNFAETSLVLDILPIADSFEKAFSDKSWDSLDKTWQAGIKSLYGQLMNVLKEHSLEFIKSEGEKFNPQEHESVGEAEVDGEAEDGTVVREVRKGYKMKGKVLRPAQVEVGKYNK